MKVNDINATKQERLELRKHYNEEQLIELFGIGDKKSPVKQSDVTKVLQNIEARKSGTHPVRFKDGEVVEIDPKLATRINNWMAQRDNSQSKEDEKMVSSWEGFQKIAKLLGIEKMLPKPKMADDINRMLNLAGVEEGYYKLPDYDKDKYQQRDGLEGPIPTKTGKVLYYDPKEGMYYDPDTDMFITYDEFRQYDGYDESIEEYDAKGMNKYGISAVHKDGKFYAFRNGKMVGGPFDTIEQLADFQKKSIENEDTQQELPLPVNYTFTKTDFLDNEAENMHTENAVELAMMFGTEEEQKRMNMIMTAHNTRGYILPDEQEERDALVRKYYPMLEDVVAEEDNTYTVVHAKHGKEEIKAPSSYAAAKKFADMKKLKSTAGVDAHLHTKEEDINEYNTDKVQSTYDAIIKGIRNRGPAEESEVGDYIPSGMTGEEIRKLIDMLEPQGYDKEFLLKDLGPMMEAQGNSVLDRLRLIVKDKSNAKVQLDDGHLTVDLYTASAITQVYDKVNDANKAKMEKMMNTKEGLVKLTNAVFGMLNKRKDEDIEEKVDGVIDENVINAYRQLVEKKLNESVAGATEEDEVKQILAKHDVTDIEDIEYSSPVYDELFDYYSNSGEMPYGVMKARTGMPDEWIYDRLQDLGLLEAKLTKAQIKKRDKIADKMPDAEFKKRYGKDADAVKYGAATNMVKDDINEAHTMTCKYCGDEIYKPTTDCSCDCNNPDGDNWVIKRTMEDNVQEGEQVTREEEQQLLKKVDEFKTKDQEVKDIEAKEKALQDIQMNKHTSKDPELQDEIKNRKAELDRLKKLAGV